MAAAWVPRHSEARGEGARRIPSSGAFLARHTHEPETGTLGMGWASLRACHVRGTETSAASTASLCVGFLALGPPRLWLAHGPQPSVLHQMPGQIKAGPRLQLTWSRAMLGSALGTEEGTEAAPARPLARACLGLAQGPAPLRLCPGLTLQLPSPPGPCEALLRCLPVAGCPFLPPRCPTCFRTLGGSSLSLPLQPLSACGPSVSIGGPLPACGLRVPVAPAVVTAATLGLQGVSLLFRHCPGAG